MYIERLADFAGEDTRKIWENKIEGSGSPIYEAQSRKREEQRKMYQIIPEDWKQKIYKEDGGRKKIIFFEISILSLSKYGIKTIKKIKHCFELFIKYNMEITVLWKLQPAVWQAFEQKQDLIFELQDLVAWYKTNQIGIFDDKTDSKYAMLLCDGYYGDSPTTARICSINNKPVMLMNVNV